MRNRKLLLTSGLAVAASLIALAAAFGLLEASSSPVDTDSSTCGTGSLHHCSDCIAAGYELQVQCHDTTSDSVTMVDQHPFQVTYSLALFQSA